MFGASTANCFQSPCPMLTMPSMLSTLSVPRMRAQAMPACLFCVGASLLQLAAMLRSKGQAPGHLTHICFDSASPLASAGGHAAKRGRGARRPSDPGAARAGSAGEV